MARNDDSDGETNAGDVNAAAAAVVRLALFHEYRRAPLKRATINAVLPQKVNFIAVYARAQETLASTFGMRLVELRARHKGDAVDERAEAAEAEAQATQANQTAATQAATQKKRKGKGRAREEEEDDDDDSEEDADAEADAEPEAGDQGEQANGATASPKKKKTKKRPKTNTYILRNILPPKLIAAMNAPRPLPLFDAEDVATTEANARDSGALIPWEKTDVGGSIELLGIRTVILCLILTMGRSADDLKLMSLLRRLGLQRDTILPFSSPDNHHAPLSLEKYLDYLARQNYLEKRKVPNPSVPDGMSVQWLWGSREAEFSEAAAALFIERLFLDPDSSGEDSESDDDVPRPRTAAANVQRTPAQKAARFKRKKAQLRVDIERAAGGPLMGEL